MLGGGALSEYYRYFDINRQHPDEHLKGRLVAPFLADSVAQSIEKGVLQLQFNAVNGFTINGFPLSVSGYALVAGLLPARFTLAATAVCCNRKDCHRHVYRKLEQQGNNNSCLQWRAMITLQRKYNGSNIGEPG